MIHKLESIHKIVIVDVMLDQYVCVSDEGMIFTSKHIIYARTFDTWTEAKSFAIDHRLPNEYIAPTVLKRLIGEIGVN